MSTAFSDLLSKVKSLIKTRVDYHDVSGTAHTNGFDHNLLVYKEADPSLMLTATGYTRGMESTSAGVISFRDKLGAQTVSLDVDGDAASIWLDVHISATGTSEVPVVASFVNTNDECWLNMRHHKIINVKAPTNNEDAANKQYVDEQIAGATAGVAKLNGGTGIITIKINNDETKTVSSGVLDLGSYLAEPTTTGIAGQVLMKTTDGHAWKDVGDAGIVTSVNGASGAVTIKVNESTGTRSGNVVTFSLNASDVGAAAASHTHSEYALMDHSHVIADVTDLQDALDGKALSSHNHTLSQITDFSAKHDAYAGAHADGFNHNVIVTKSGPAIKLMNTDADITVVPSSTTYTQFNAFDKNDVRMGGFEISADASGNHNATMVVYKSATEFTSLNLEISASGDETITSDATFTNCLAAYPTADAHIANKKYVDDKIEGATAGVASLNGGQGNIKIKINNDDTKTVDANKILDLGTYLTSTSISSSDVTNALGYTPATQSHGTHVTTSTCVTSLGGKTGAISIKINNTVKNADSSKVIDLGSYASTSHEHEKSDITDFAHTHVLNDITDFSTGHDLNLAAHDNGFNHDLLIALSPASTSTSVQVNVKNTKVGISSSTKVGKVGEFTVQDASGNTLAEFGADLTATTIDTYIYDGVHQHGIIWASIPIDESSGSGTMTIGPTLQSVNCATPTASSASTVLANKEYVDAVDLKTNPVGTIIAFAGNPTTHPEGYLLCNGATDVIKDDYKALSDLLGTIYGEGDDSTKFALPNLTDKFIEGSTTAGTSIAAALPNITGTFKEINHLVHVTGTGAFSATSTYGSKGTTDGGDYGNRGVCTFAFNASNVSSIYSDSCTTVQPPALTMRYYIKY